jgi:hypothetical protein
MTVACQMEHRFILFLSAQAPQQLYIREKPQKKGKPERSAVSNCWFLCGVHRKGLIFFLKM